MKYLKKATSAILALCMIFALCVSASAKGPVDKSKNSAETHSGSSRTVNLGIAKDGILPSA